MKTINDLPYNNYKSASEIHIGEIVWIHNKSESTSDDVEWVTAKLIAILPKDNPVTGKQYLCERKGELRIVKHALTLNEKHYHILHFASGLNIGDWVKIEHSARTSQQGWHGNWIADHTNHLNKLGKITNDFGILGYEVTIDNIDSQVSLVYPSFSLRKVGKIHIDKHDKLKTIYVSNEGFYTLIDVVEDLNKEKHVVYQSPFDPKRIRITHINHCTLIKTDEQNATEETSTKQ